jgi:hypothetical protein
MGIRYALGLCAQLGFGTDGTVFGDHLAVEPLGLELRSGVSRRAAFHTTLNAGRMLAAAAQGDGRIEYDTHFGGAWPVAPAVALVVAPGASLGYSYTGSRYQRFVGDVRVGVERHEGTWTTGVYLRPWVGRWRPVGAADGVLAVGGLVEWAVLVDTHRSADAP